MITTDHAPAQDPAAKLSLLASRSDEGELKQQSAADEEGAGIPEPKDEAAQKVNGAKQAAEAVSAELQQASKPSIEPPIESPKAPADPVKPQAVMAGWPMAVGTVLVWVMILGFFGWFVSRHDEAAILMQVRQEPQLVVSGAIVFQGKPVSRGSLQLVFDDPSTGQHLASAVLAVHDGLFTTSGDAILAPTKQLRISAAFVGQYDAPDKQHEPKSIEASDVIYTNCAPPFSEQSVIGVSALIGVVVLALIVLFIGNFTRTSAAFLFGSAYLFTFLSVTVPIVGLLIVSTNHYLLETMKASPIGIVVAKTKALTEPQWLLNVGGVVVEGPDTPDTAPSAPPTASAAAPTASAAPPIASAESEAASATPPAASAASEVASAPTTAAAAPPSVTAQSAVAATASPVVPTPPVVATVHGGLAIPFYVILLAIFGAGLKMMRRVPQIQAEHALALPEGRGMKQVMVEAVGLGTPQKVAGTLAEIQASCDIRRGVIEQYMYLLSAPFLAIAVYYLLQIVASNISEPVLVLMAFSAGLVSESIVSAIIQFAEKTLGSARDADGKDTPHQEAADPVAGA